MSHISASVLDVASSCVNNCLYATRNTFIKVLQGFPSGTPPYPINVFFQSSYWGSMLFPSECVSSGTRHFPWDLNWNYCLAIFAITWCCCLNTITLEEPQDGNCQFIKKDNAFFSWFVKMTFFAWLLVTFQWLKTKYRSFQRIENPFILFLKN